MKYRLSLIAVGIFLCLIFMHTATATAASPDRGLFITPSRQYVTTTAGQTSAQPFTVANLTKGDMTVVLSVEQFSATDYTYSYVFQPPKENWIHFETTQLALKPGQVQKLSYTIVAPKDATPGGHYFTVFVTTTLPNGDRARAALVVYLTISGNLTKTSTITGDTFPSVSFGGDISFTLDLRNTGNTHFFIYNEATVTNGIIHRSVNEEGHILLPKTVRAIDYSIPSPVLPGIYRADYGYKTDSNQDINRTKYFVYAPLWSFALLIGLIWLGTALVKWRRRLIAVANRENH